MKICPYLESSFQILGRRWNGLIVHYLSNCPNYTAHFSDLKKDLTDITPRALSLKLTELAEHGLVEKNMSTEQSVQISYHLTDTGQELAEALKPVHAWAKKHISLEN
ncbi:helix-turn-helix domain-containing protein [Psychrobacillus sp. FJAT-21963]|uniref:winged helix-turn-helix transcriptional regulator n=1 Tax=Psychrobacillus sp. FJAT-21963 TaxID=1712028 RepID=UPI0006F3D247|nr:helix-turn-helix domain-containing protein [Psychrobacillus sp. FJAT-21963]KQL35061.1 HxlR family transcriptional regulator [Psychrobacillus sp. FJAT-21963]